MFPRVGGKQRWGLGGPAGGKDVWRQLWLLSCSINSDRPLGPGVSWILCLWSAKRQLLSVRHYQWQSLQKSAWKCEMVSRTLTYVLNQKGFLSSRAIRGSLCSGSLTLWMETSRANFLIEVLFWRTVTVFANQHFLIENHFVSCAPG